MNYCIMGIVVFTYIIFLLLLTSFNYLYFINSAREVK